MRTLVHLRRTRYRPCSGTYKEPGTGHARALTENPAQATPACQRASVSYVTHSPCPPLHHCPSKTTRSSANHCNGTTAIINHCNINNIINNHNIINNNHCDNDDCTASKGVPRTTPLLPAQGALRTTHGDRTASCPRVILGSNLERWQGILGQYM